MNIPQDNIERVQFTSKMTVLDDCQQMISDQIQIEYIIDADRDYQIVRNILTEEYFTARIIKKSNLVKGRQRQNLINEIKITKNLKSPYLLNCQRIFEDQQNVYILNEYFSEQTLDQLIQQGKLFSEQDIRHFLKQMIAGLKYLQDSLVIHRNLKLKNIFINKQKEIRIGGFQYATKLNKFNEKRYSICGSQNYLAPEILLNQGYSFEVDIWALGNILYALYFGKFPFSCQDLQETYKKIKMNQLNFPEDIIISLPFRYLITTMLDQNPTLRPRLQEINSHQFLIGDGTNTDNDQKIMKQ